MSTTGILTLLLGLLAVGNPQNVPQSTEVLNLRNFGLVLQPISTMIPYRETWQHTFAINISALKDLPTPRFIQCVALPTTQLNEFCTSQRPLIDALETMDRLVITSLKETVKNLFDHIQVSLPDADRSRRAPLSFIGSFFHSLIGVSTDDDVDRQNKIILELQKSTAAALDTMAVHTDKLASFMALSNKRLIQFDRMIADQQAELNIVVDKFKQQFMSSQANQNLLASAINRVAAFTQNLEHLNSFEWAVTLAAHGMLTPELIPANAITEVIASLERVIKRMHAPGYLIRTRPADVYASKDFNIRISDPFLLVTIRLPMSPTHVPLTVYKMIALPTPVPNQPQHFTRMTNLPAAVAFHPASDMFMVFPTLPQIPENRLLNLQQSSLLILDKTMDSCMSAIITQNALLISKLCTFEFYDNVVEPRVVHVATATLILINVPSYTLTCQNGTAVTIKPPPHIEIEVPCACRFSSAYGMFSTRLVHCTSDSTQPTVLFPTNYAVLQRFFNQSDLNSLTVSSAFKTPLPIVLPNISIFQHKYANDLANTQKTALELDQVVNLTQKDSQVFRSLTDKVLFHIDTAELPIVSSSLALFSWQTLLLLVCSLAILVLAFIVYTLNTRVRALTLSLGLAAQVPRSMAQAVYVRNPFNYFDGLTTKFPDLPRLPLEIDYKLPTLDLLLLLFLLLAFLIFGLIWYRHSIAMRATFAVMLELGSPTKSILINFMDLPHIPEMVEINVTAPLENIILSGVFFPELHFAWPGLTIYNTFSKITYPIPRSLKLSYWQAHKLRQLIQQPYYVLLFTYFKRTLTPIKIPFEIAHVTRSSTMNLYPGLVPPYNYSSFSRDQLPASSTTSA